MIEQTMREAVIEMVGRRPSTTREIAECYAFNRNSLTMLCWQMVQQRLIHVAAIEGRTNRYGLGPGPGGPPRPRVRPPKAVVVPSLPDPPAPPVVPSPDDDLKPVTLPDSMFQVGDRIEIPTAARAPVPGWRFPQPPLKGV